jgi:hypothetical protein
MYSTGTDFLHEYTKQIAFLVSPLKGRLLVRGEKNSPVYPGCRFNKNLKEMLSVKDN